jgi:hypothetical protein
LSKNRGILHFDESFEPEKCVYEEDTEFMAQHIIALSNALTRISVLDSENAMLRAALKQRNQCISGDMQVDESRPSKIAEIL